MPEKPVIFIKTGVIYCLPPDFDDRLAQLYDAQVVGFNEAGVYLKTRTDPEARSRELLLESRQRARSYLTDGFNVVFSPFLNRHTLRREVKRRASVVGASTVRLSIHTPSDMIEKNIRRHHGPSADLVLTLARRMQESIQWPRMEEEHISLNGALEVERLLARIANVIPPDFLD